MRRIGLLLVLILVGMIAWRLRHNDRFTSRLLKSGGWLIFAVFAAYGFIASGELKGTAGVVCRSGYATLGAFALAGAVWKAARGRSADG